MNRIQPEYMMTIFLQLHKLDSLQWRIAVVDYPARGQAHEFPFVSFNYRKGYLIMFPFPSLINCQNFVA